MAERTKGQIEGVKKQDWRTVSRKYQQAGIIKVAADTVQDICKWLDENPEKTLEDYGHGLGMLAHVIASGERKAPEKQIEYLKPRAESLVRKYGEHIISFMRPELREALGFQDQVEAQAHSSDI